MLTPSSSLSITRSEEAGASADFGGGNLRERDSRTVKYEEIKLKDSRKKSYKLKKSALSNSTHDACVAVDWTIDRLCSVAGWN